MRKNFSRAANAVDSLASTQAVDCFNPEARTPDTWEQRQEDGLGIAISNWADGDPAKLMRVFGAALESQNLHQEAASVRRKAKKLAG